MGFHYDIFIRMDHGSDHIYSLFPIFLSCPLPPPRKTFLLGKWRWGLSVKGHTVQLLRKVLQINWIHWVCSVDKGAPILTVLRNGQERPWGHREWFRLIGEAVERGIWNQASIMYWQYYKWLWVIHIPVVSNLYLPINNRESRAICR